MYIVLAFHDIFNLNKTFLIHNMQLFNYEGDGLTPFFVRLNDYGRRSFGLFFTVKILHRLGIGPFSEEGEMEPDSGSDSKARKPFFLFLQPTTSLKPSSLSIRNGSGEGSTFISDSEPESETEESAKSALDDCAEAAEECAEGAGFLEFRKRLRTWPKIYGRLPWRPGAGCAI